MIREELFQMVELLRDTAKLHQPNEEILTDVKAESFIFVMDSVLSALSENKGEWIPVSERLPEDDTEVIYCDKNGVRGNCHYWKGFNRYPRDKGEYQFPNDIVAWMPLPEPYKEGGE